MPTDPSILDPKQEPEQPPRFDPSLLDPVVATVEEAPIVAPEVQAAPFDDVVLDPSLNMDGKLDTDPTSVGEFFRQYMLTIQGIDPRAPDAPTLGETLTIAPSGPSFADIQEGFIEGGQNIQKALLSPSATGMGGTDPRGAILGQAFAVAGQTVSGALELFTGPNPDEDTNFLFNAARTIRESTRSPEEIIANENLPEKFSRGILQGASFMASGRGAQVLLKETPRAAAYIAAWLGAGVGGQAGREDAIRHGATEEQVAIAFSANALFGTSEGLSIGYLLNKLDDATGGVISSRMKSTAGKFLASGLEGGIVEFLQEGFQTIGENWTAAEIAAYDPGRPWNEHLAESAGIGGSVGLTLSLLATAFGVRKQRDRQIEVEAEIKEKILEPLGIKTLDDLMGPMSLITDRIEELRSDPDVQEFENILEDKGELDVDLKKQADREVVVARQEVGGALLDISTQNRAAVPTLVNLLRGTALDNDYLVAVNSARLTQGLEEASSLEEALLNNSVVTAFSQILIEDEQAHAQTINQLKKFEARRESEGPTLVGEAAIADLEITIKGFEAAQETELELAKSLKNLYTLLNPLLGKNSTILIENTALDAQKSPKSTGGEYGAVELFSEAIVVNVISLRTQEVSRAAANFAMNPTATNQTILTRKKGELLGSALHEFGHAVAFNKINQLVQDEREGSLTEENTKILNAIRNDYNQFLVNSLNVSASDALVNILSLPRFGAFTTENGDKLNFTDVVPFGESEFSQNHLINENFISKDTFEYLFSFKEYLAEEFAKAMLDSSEVSEATAPFFNAAVKDIKEALAIHKKKFRTSTPTLKAFARSHGQRQQIKTLEKIVGPEEMPSPIKAIFNDGLLTKEQFDRLSGEADTFNRFMDVGFNILQIAEQNPHVAGLQFYVENLRAWKNEVNQNLATAESRLSSWKNLGSEEIEKLGRLLFDETIGRLPDGGWLESPRNFTEEEAATYNLSEDGLVLRRQIKEDLLDSLDQMEEVLITAKKRIFSNDIIKLTQEINRVKADFRDMRSRPYFPLMRFGDWILQVRSKGEQRIEGKDYTDDQIVEYQTFDTKKERDRALTVANKHFGKEQVVTSSSHRVTPSFSLQGMPLTMLEHLEGNLISSQHTKEVNEAIEKAIAELKNDVLPFKSFRKQFQRRKRVEGFSIDAQRSYANYMTSFANHIARVKFDPQFKENFDNVKASITVIRKQLGEDSKRNSDKRAMILNHMNNHLEYVMNPVNEFVGLRSAAFFWFLGFNVKSAFVNLTQIPLVTYPYLAARYGDGKAVAAITRAYKTAATAMRNPDKIDENLLQMIEQGLSESWLDESLATELALAASEKNLEKTLPRHWRQQAWLQISHYGSLPFHVAEKYNRHITAIASYQLAQTKGKLHEQAVFEARRAVEKTQFEYARWARPRFMRGKVGGTVFVFQNYMQNALFFALGGDPGAFRMLIMLFSMSGVMGLPFAENITDLIDAAMSTLKRKTGVKDPHTAIRVDLRKMLKELDVDPDLVLHGLSSSTFGLANIGEFMGWPIPDIDLSGSLSMGRIVPGTELLAPGQANTFERAASGALGRAAGAIGSAGVGVGQALFNNHPDQWKRWEKAMPKAMQQISKAARFAVRGGEETRAGKVISDFDLHDPRDVAEIVAQSLGFTPRELSRGWEGFIAKQQSIIYYRSWRTGLLLKWNHAKVTGNKEAEKSTNAEIREYNTAVPFGEMRVTSEVRIQSFETYRRARQFTAADVEQSRPFRRLSSSIEAVFEEENTEDTP